MGRWIFFFFNGCLKRYATFIYNDNNIIRYINNNNNNNNIAIINTYVDVSIFFSQCPWRQYVRWREYIGYTRFVQFELWQKSKTQLWR